MKAPTNKAVIRPIVKSDVSDKVKKIVKDTKPIAKVKAQVSKIKKADIILKDAIKNQDRENVLQLPQILDLPKVLPKAIDYIKQMRSYLNKYGIKLAHRYELRLMKVQRFLIELSFDEKNIKQLLEKKELSSYELSLALHYNVDELLTGLSIEEGKELAHIYLEYSYNLYYILQDFSNLDMSIVLVDVLKTIKVNNENPSKFNLNEYKEQSVRAFHFENGLKEFNLAIESCLVKLNDLDMEQDNDD